jgi:hypothetical protein
MATLEDCLAESVECLKVWEPKAKAYAEAKEAYRFAWAEAFAARENVKPESARKAQCDALTHELRLRRDLLEISATSAWQVFLALRGPMDNARQPGNNFGDAA